MSQTTDIHTELLLLLAAALTAFLYIDRHQKQIHIPGKYARQ